MFLINPNGILIGKDAYINTAGFVASTLDLLNEDLSEKTLQFRGLSEESVVNEGKIHCTAGDVFLVGRRVENSGEIFTENGSQGLLSGFDVVLQPESAPRVQIRSEQLVAKDEFAKNPYALAIRHSGKSRTGENQSVYVSAAKGLSEVSGEITSPGGTVHLLGDAVHVKDAALIDVSHEMGGGEVLIGGDYQGKTPEIKNAQRTFIEKGVEFKADALRNGDGGKVIVWADKATDYYGHISAQGGAQSGDGGFVEVSGKQLNFRGTAITRAPFGKTGTLLLDPTNVTISTADSGGSFSGCVSGTNTFTPDASPTGDTINAATLVGLLNAPCNVLISTVGSTGTQTGIITVSNPVVWGAESSLVLHAASTMAVNANLTSTNTATGFTAITLVADGTSAATHGISIPGTVTISAVGGDIILFATAPASGANEFGIFLNGLITTTNGTIQVAAVIPSGTNASRAVVFNSASNNITSMSGNIFVSGDSSNAAGAMMPGVDVGTPWAAGTTGMITLGSTINNPTASSPSSITGCQGGSGTSSNGISLRATFSTGGAVVFENCVGGLNATTGGTGVFISSPFTAVGSITATTSIIGQGAAGVGFASSSTFSVTGTNSSITIAATSAATAGAGIGISITGGTMSTATGPLNLTGAATGTSTGSALGISITALGKIASSAGSITLSGTSNGTGVNSHGVLIAVAQNISTTGTVTFQNSQGGGNSTCHGVSIANTFSTQGTLVFGTITSGTGASSNGVNIAGAITASNSIIFATVTANGSSGYAILAIQPITISPGQLIATQGITTGTGSGNVGWANTENVTVTGTISITAISNSTSGNTIGVNLAGGTMSTSGSSPILLAGVAAGSSSGQAFGISVNGGQIVSSSGAIQLTGTATSNGSAATGISLTTGTNVITSTNNGAIQLSGTGTVTTTNIGSGIIINVTSWEPGTNATVTFTNSSGAGISGSAAGIAVDILGTLTTVG